MKGFGNVRRREVDEHMFAFPFFCGAEREVVGRGVLSGCTGTQVDLPEKVVREGLFAGRMFVSSCCLANTSRERRT